MTNGEKFKQIFSITQVDEGELYAFAWLHNHDAAEFSIEWWNAEYKESKPGHWISHGEHCENLGVIPSGLGAYEWCSNCDCGIDVREWHRNHYNFCPNCGAKMVELQKSEG